jgi:hypothetical protein
MSVCNSSFSEGKILFVFHLKKEKSGATIRNKKHQLSATTSSNFMQQLWAMWGNQWSGCPEKILKQHKG